MTSTQRYELANRIASGELPDGILRHPCFRPSDRDAVARRVAHLRAVEADPFHGL